jgi:thiosulfate reductase cytochrome b subunit
MKRLETKHPLAIRWLHWVNFPALLVMLWSGLLIYWAGEVYRLGRDETTLFKFFPEKFYERTGVGPRLAEGMNGHFTFAWLFTLNGIAYVLYVWLSGEWRHLLPRRDSFMGATPISATSSTTSPGRPACATA